MISRELIDFFSVLVKESGGQLFLIEMDPNIPMVGMEEFGFWTAFNFFIFQRASSSSRSDLVHVSHVVVFQNMIVSTAIKLGGGRAQKLFFQPVHSTMSAL